MTDEAPKAIVLGDFTISVAEGTRIMIGAEPDPANKVVLAIAYRGSVDVTVQVKVTVRCGQEEAALLATTDNLATVTPEGLGNLSRSIEGDDLSWESGVRGSTIKAGQTCRLTIEGFACSTPPGTARVDVLLKTKPPAAQPAMGTLGVKKGVTIPVEAKVHYFVAEPPFVLYGGQTPVKLSFLATGCESVKLYRNNQLVRHAQVLKEGTTEKKEWREMWSREELSSTQAAQPGAPQPDPSPRVVTLEDTPSITTIYRLVPQQQQTPGDLPPIDRTVQVAAPGWNRLALPQGYLTRLFVARLGGQNEPTDRLYGIFVNGSGKGTLYSSATGFDDWREEDGEVPVGMETSPGVTLPVKIGDQIRQTLWLVGGSCVDGNQPNTAVWCYEPETDTQRYAWKKKTALSFPDAMKPRAGHACVVVPIRQANDTIEQEIWVIGGYNNGSLFGDIWTLKPNENVWKQLPQTTPFPPRWQHAATVYRRAGEASVWVYGGVGRKPEGFSEVRLTDLWSCDASGKWSSQTGPVPGPGKPYASALITMPRSDSTAGERLFLAGTFLLEGQDTNVTISRFYEWQPPSKKWEAEDIGRGWDRFEGNEFHMQAVVFNRFLFVWSMHPRPNRKAPPRLNVLIPS